MTADEAVRTQLPVCLLGGTELEYPPSAAGLNEHHQPAEHKLHICRDKYVNIDMVHLKYRILSGKRPWVIEIHGSKIGLALTQTTHLHV